MNYLEFNQNVYNYYLENFIVNNYNSLAIIKSDFDELIEDEKYIKNFHQINNDDWSLLLKFKDGIPKYLGLIAIQCHAAFYMQNDGQITAGNFRDRYKSITGIKSTQKLNQLLSEKISKKNNVQEKIWLEAKNFFESKDINLEIPNPKSYSGRNIQFPVSQCVLNYEDLKEYKGFYCYIYENYEFIHFDGFITEFKKFETSLIGQFRRVNNLRTLTEIEKKIKSRQIFDFYNSLEWLKFDKRQPSIKKTNKVFFAKLVHDEVKIYDEDFELFTNYSDLLDKNKIAIFKQEGIYITEFTKCNHIDNNTSFIIITSSQELNRELMGKNGKVINLSSASSNLFVILIDFKEEIPSCLLNYQSQEFPVKILGKKISSKRQYLLSNLPRLESLNGIPYRLYCNSNRVVGKQPILPGNYLIKVNGFTSYSFEIIEDVILEDEVLESNYKLKLSTLEYSDDGNMSGLDIKTFTSQVEDKFSINKWIKSLSTSTNFRNKLNTQNPLIKAINQYQYGKY